MNRYVKDHYAQGLSYEGMNAAAAAVDPGSDGLMVFPFGNGAERMLNNRLLGASLHGMDFNRHSPAHLFRATQEGIAFAFRYGLELLQGTGIEPHILRAGKANMLLSPLFTKVLVDVTGVPLELRQADGSIGAAMGAGIGLGYYSDPAEALRNVKALATIVPERDHPYEALYQKWKTRLEKALVEL
jgi:xylulokinase